MVSNVWIARPVYELLPYLYMIIGMLLLGAAWSSESTGWPGVFMLTGAVSLLGGIVLWLRRRDFRSRQAEYDEKSLEI